MAFHPPLNIVAKELERVNTIQSEPIQMLEDERQVIIDWKSQGPLRYTTLSVEDDKDEYWLANFERLHEEYSDAQSKLLKFATQQEEIEYLKSQVASLQKELFGTSSEKLPKQVEGANDDENSNSEVVENIRQEKITKVRDINSYTGRKRLPEHLPREKVVYSLPLNERTCACGNGKFHKIGEECVEKATIVRQVISVRKIITEKYSCRSCGEIRNAPKPKTMVPGSSYDTPEFLADIATNRYQHGLPFYRLETVYGNLGLHIPRSTIANLMINTADKLVGIRELMREELISQPVIHADETSMQVLKEAGRKPQQKSYQWLFMSGAETARPVIYFDYNTTRSGQFAADTLALNGSEYRGYLSVDGYKGYNKVSSAIRVGCMAHVRRKFNEALEALPNNAQSSNAQTALEMIAQLYEVEKRIKSQPPDEKYKIRQRDSVPILNQIKDWLDNLVPKVLPRSPLGKAINYLLSEWRYVSRYVDDGRLAIDNNIAERQIKQFVIGRKNWLFADSVDGAHTNAIMYSLIATAKANGLNPHDYLLELFTKLPNIKADELQTLLPWSIKNNQQELKKVA